MGRRVVGFLLPAALVALGGCNGAFAPSVENQSPDGRTVTPAPVPTTRTTDAPARPAWVENGRLDMERLRRAHRRALDGPGHAW